MKKETIHTPQQNNTDEGFPLPATIMLGAIVLAVIALILKVIGLFQIDQRRLVNYWVPNNKYHSLYFNTFDTGLL